MYIFCILCPDNRCLPVPVVQKLGMFFYLFLYVTTSKVVAKKTTKKF